LSWRLFLPPYSECQNSNPPTFVPTRQVQIGDPEREGEDSGFEALLHLDGTFYVIRESIAHVDFVQRKLSKSKAAPRIVTSYHAVVLELSMGEDDYEVVDSCSSEFEFEGDSKGFEGKEEGM
jgi:hypothetical protein